MGEKNITGLDGTIYIQDPNGQGWQPCKWQLDHEDEIEPLPDWPKENPYLSKLIQEEIAIAEFNTAYANLREAVLEAFQPIVEWAATLATKLSDLFTTWHENCVFIKAYFWARDAHPEWVKVLNRTKKKRTRKKYQDRILRAYLKNKES